MSEDLGLSFEERVKLRKKREEARKKAMLEGKAVVLEVPPPEPVKKTGDLLERRERTHEARVRRKEWRKKREKWYFKAQEVLSEGEYKEYWELRNADKLSDLEKRVMLEYEARVNRALREEEE